ncbi:amidohydrolase family protein [Microvirga sp. BSC39]|uniref:amidohydrolase family protein n=1 Tax=Microvirga sp. BSC39 TaxID=1549810 RepID=UPI001FCAC007|nr:amidohydrolase family protein [Microvirga sp. BSC39]
MEQRLVFDALILPRHLSRPLLVADRHPDLSIVVDHGAKPFIREGVLDPWRADMVAVAARPNIVCKLSGLVTEAKADWTVSDLHPYVDYLLEVFGPQRLLWGSDWPASILRAGMTGGERGPLISSHPSPRQTKRPCSEVTRLGSIFPAGGGLRREG